MQCLAWTFNNGRLNNYIKLDINTNVTSNRIGPQYKFNTNTLQLNRFFVNIIMPIIVNVKKKTPFYYE